MSKYRVLMLSCSWPPLMFAGTHRPLRLSERLDQYGWSPTILTPTLTRSPYEADLTLDFEISAPEHVPVIRPNHPMPRWRARRRMSQLAHLLGQGRLFVAAMNRFVLAPSFFGEWTDGALRCAKKAHSEQPFDALWVTGGHWGLFPTATSISKVLDVPLILDYRDPWTASPDEPELAGMVRHYQRRIEARCLSQAHGVSFVHPRCLEENRRVFGQSPNALWRVIYNGYVERELTATPLGQDMPTVVHGGNCYAQRSALPIIKALNALAPKSRPRVQFFGALDGKSRHWIDRNSAPGAFEHKSLVSNQVLTQHLLGSAAQLILVGENHAHAVPSKLFDYMLTGRPILGVGPNNSEVREIIEECGLGLWCNSDDHENIKRALILARNGEIPFAPNKEKISQFSADRMAENTAKLLTDVVERYRAGTP